MQISTKINLETQCVVIELETDDRIMEISVNLKDVEKNVKAMSGITDNLIAQKAVEFFSSMFGIKLNFRKK